MTIRGLAIDGDLAGALSRTATATVPAEASARVITSANVPQVQQLKRFWEKFWDWTTPLLVALLIVLPFILFRIAWNE